MPDQINDQYERRHFRSQERTVREIEQEYNEVINKIAPLLVGALSDILLRRRINRLLRDMSNNIEGHIYEGIQRSWQISNDRTFQYLDKRLKGYPLPPNITTTWYDPNAKALEQFQHRRRNGLTISQRVWRHVKGMNKTIEAVQAKGIEEGTSAATIARRLRKELRNPTRQDNPGQGIYKSPVKNSERLTRTETNMAYRSADQHAWKNNPMVLGYEINLTQTRRAKVRCEICRALEGRYPVDFIWSGWHPQCLCFKTPIFFDDKAMDQYTRLISEGRDSKEAIAELRKKFGLITDHPSAFKKWVRDNNDRVKGWKNNPYWWDDNNSVVRSILAA